MCNNLFEVSMCDWLNKVILFTLAIRKFNILGILLNIEMGKLCLNTKTLIIAVKIKSHLIGCVD